MAEKPKKTSIELYDEDAEASVVTAIILDPSLLSKIDIDPYDFFNITYKTIFLAELAIKQRNEEITEASVEKETAHNIDAYVIPKLVAQLEADIDAVKCSNTIKEYSRKRKFIKITSELIRVATDGAKTSQQLIDDLQAEIEALRFPSDVSRMVYFTGCRIRTSEPPTYVITVKALASGKFFEVDCTSTEVEAPRVIKRKIREKANINPILPKGYDSLLHKLVTNAKLSEAPKDSSTEEQVCFWIREWFKMATEIGSKGTKDDLMAGYIERHGRHYFRSQPILRWLNEKGKTKLSAQRLWPILERYGGVPDKPMNVSGSTIRLYGLPNSFFEEEEKTEPEEEEQLKLDDMSWLEE